MKNETELKAHIDNVKARLAKQQEREVEAWRAWKAQNETHFQETLAQIPDDPRTKYFHLSSDAAHNVNTPSEEPINVQACVAQCEGGRKRLAPGKKPGTAQQIHYQQDRFAAMTIPLLNQLSTIDVINLITETFNEIGEKTASLRNGTTATLCIVKNSPNNHKKRVIFAWIGDSRGAVYHHGEVKHMTVDHHPQEEAENARLRAADPNFKPEQKKLVTKRDYYNSFNRNKIQLDCFLSPSRSFGNKDFKGSSHEPEFMIADIEDPNAKILMASDGIWDKVSAADMQAIMQQHDLNDAQKANALRKLSFQRGAHDYLRNQADPTQYPPYIPDNITMLIGELSGAYLLLDGHGSKDVCVDQVMQGVASTDNKPAQPSFLELFDQKVKAKVTNNELLDESDELPPSQGMTFSLSLPSDDNANIAQMEFDQSASSPEQDIDLGELAELANVASQHGKAISSLSSLTQSSAISRSSSNTTIMRGLGIDSPLRSGNHDAAEQETDNVYTPALSASARDLRKRALYRASESNTSRSSSTNSASNATSASSASSASVSDNDDDRISKRTRLATATTSAVSPASSGSPPCAIEATSSPQDEANLGARLKIKTPGGGSR